MTCMLTLLDINRAIDRLGVGAFARARYAPASQTVARRAPLLPACGGRSDGRRGSPDHRDRRSSRFSAT
jgi:hypothetical protein